MTDQTPQPYFPALAAFCDKYSDRAYPLVRFVVGAWMVPHGMQKLFGAFGGGGIGGTTMYMAKNGLEPAIVFAWLAILIEFFGGIAVAVGFLTRPIAFLFFVEMLIAIFVIHLPNGWFWAGRGIEYPLMWGLIALAVAIKGSGRCSIDRMIGKEV
ncbi:MAG TPA: DoxX family protein [Alphaproteobacteria bacterium]|nr:DoxX family protein [Alphaproteobacteria bacterium]